MKKVTQRFTAVYKKVDSMYLGWVEEVPGVNTQGESLAEVKANLAEALRLILETNRTLFGDEDAIREPLAVTF